MDSILRYLRGLGQHLKTVSAAAAPLPQPTRSLGGLGAAELCLPRLGDTKGTWCLGLGSWGGLRVLENRSQGPLTGLVGMDRNRWGLWSRGLSK